MGRAAITSGPLDLVVATEFGDLLLSSLDGQRLSAVRLPGTWRRDGPGGSAQRQVPGCDVLDEAAAQVAAYLAGARRQFELPIAPVGTAWQRGVWEALRAIPYGSTRSYADIARSLGVPGAARAVGGAAHHNPLPIVVPCHRVVGADGSLTGFGGGLALKRHLLDLESGTLLW